MEKGRDGLLSPRDTAELLIEEARAINRVEFIADDPVQFPRRYERLQDIEIASLLSAIIAWGKRSMICRDAERMLALTEGQPHAYVLEGGFEDVSDDMNLHRTLFGRHFKWLLRGLREIYSRYDSLDAFATAIRVGEDGAPAWKLVEELGRIAADANGGASCSQCLPTNLKTTALKRVNMALRWLVRRDGIVDMGVWHSVRPSQLYIPLDVHVGNTARDLGILSRKSNDRKAVEQLTEYARSIMPEDPALLDYALFGIGVRGGKATIENNK